MISYDRATKYIVPKNVMMVGMYKETWKYSIRGIIVMLLLYTPSLLPLYLGEDSALILLPLSIPMWPVIWLVGLPYTLFGVHTDLSVFFQQIIVLIVTVLIGAILGYIYSRIKGHNKKSPPQV